MTVKTLDYIEYFLTYILPWDSFRLGHLLSTKGESQDKLYV